MKIVFCFILCLIITVCTTSETTNSTNIELKNSSAIDLTNLTRHQIENLSASELESLFGNSSANYENTTLGDWSSYYNQSLKWFRKLHYEGPVCEEFYSEGYNFTNLMDIYKNCKYIQGSITFFMSKVNQNYNKKDLENVSFPSIRQVSDYVLIYDTYGFTSLSQLFPNLNVINGNTLYMNKYALVVMRNQDLLEIGLDNLTHIRSGTVRIQGNRALCYLRTVNWGLLGGKTNQFLSISKKVNFNKDEACLDVCPEICPENCWGFNRCQKPACPSACPDACALNGSCSCHEECLSGCVLGGDASECFACKTYTNVDRCVSKCPEGRYLNNQSKVCLSADHCSKLGWFIYDDAYCVKRCPSGFRINNARCEKCVNMSCPIICESHSTEVLIENLNAAKHFRHCEIIQTRLVFQMSHLNDHIYEELEDIFKNVEAISTLVVRQSNLDSLKFLKNLKRITGEGDFTIVRNVPYSLYILDNKMLGDLWFEKPFSEVNLNITGRVFINFNPYLCKDYIDFVRNCSSEVEDDTDISPLTNAPSCLVIPMNISVNSTASLHKPGKSQANFYWTQPSIPSQHNYGYYIYYKRSEYKNATRRMRDEHDSCQRTSWKLHTMLSNSNSALIEVDAYTQYAYFIKTKVPLTASTRVESDIQYFKSSIAVPLSPKYQVVKALNYSTLKIYWKEPEVRSGPFSHYEIQVKRLCEDTTAIRSFKGCARDLHKKTDDENEEASEDSSEDPFPSCIETSDYDKTPSERPRNSYLNVNHEMYDFDNSIVDSLFPPVLNSGLEDLIFNKSLSPSSRRRRDISNETLLEKDANQKTSSFFTCFPQGNMCKPGSISFTTNLTEYYLTGLCHYTEYQVSVATCITNPKTNAVICTSPKVIGQSNKRTLPKPDVDVVTNIKTQINGTDPKTLLITFTPPNDPNSYVKYYDILFTHKFTGHFESECCSYWEYIQQDMCVIKLTKTGEYQLQIEAVSLAGQQFAVKSEIVEFYVPDDSPQTHLLQIIVMCLAVLLVVSGFGISIYIKRNNSNKNKRSTYLMTVNPEYTSVGTYVPDLYEIPIDNVKTSRLIGNGEFGEVYEGIVKDILEGETETRVAVKTLIGNENPLKRQEFLKEASTMKEFNSYHVVRLLGVVSITDKPMVIMEYMSNGDLKAFLRSSRSDVENKASSITYQQKLQMCAEIADGMAYLSDCKFVHRDVAARNCLVHEDLTVKIGDFGLTRDVYETDYYRTERSRIMPVRWMSPESLKDGVFNSQSDVWSYGVVLWEIATLAEQPYQGKQHAEVTRYVIDGGYMERPKNCPKRLYEMMLSCWHYNPLMRPTFFEIVSSFSTCVHENFTKNAYVYQHHPGKNLDDLSVLDAENQLIQSKVDKNSLIEAYQREMNLNGNIYSDQHMSVGDTEKTKATLDVLERNLRHSTTFETDKVPSYHDCLDVPYTPAHFSEPNQPSNF